MSLLGESAKLDECADMATGAIARRLEDIAEEVDDVRFFFQIATGEEIVAKSTVQRVSTQSPAVA